MMTSRENRWPTEKSREERVQDHDEPGRWRIDDRDLAGIWEPLAEIREVKA